MSLRNILCKDYSDISWQPFHGGLGAIPVQLKDLLLEKNSLTARLKKLYCGDFKVEVIRQTWAKSTLSEQHFLGIADDKVNIREVLLICGGRPTVFARSVLPIDSLQGMNAELLTLGDKPLGEFLFAHKNLHRGAIQLARLTANQFNQYLCYRYTDETAWGRRSLFYLNEKPLLVCEIFLPELNEQGI